MGHKEYLYRGKTRADSGRSLVPSCTIPNAQLQRVQRWAMAFSMSVPAVVRRSCVRALHSAAAQMERCADEGAQPSLGLCRLEYAGGDFSEPTFVSSHANEMDASRSMQAEQRPDDLGESTGCPRHRASWNIGSARTASSF